MKDLIAVEDIVIQNSIKIQPILDHGASYLLPL